MATFILQLFSPTLYYIVCIFLGHCVSFKSVTQWLYVCFQQMKM